MIQLLKKLYSHASNVVFFVIVALVAGHFAINVAMIVKRVYLGKPVTDLLSFDQVAHKIDFHPWVYWKRSSQAGDDINIDKFGIRKTVKSPT